METSTILSRARQASVRVLFAEDFDAKPGPAPCAEAPPLEPEVIEPTFALADLDAARADGIAEGLAQARREADAADRNEIRLARTQLSQALAAAETEAARIAEASAAALAELLIGAAIAALPAFCDQHGAAEAAAVAAALLPALTEEPHIAIDAAPDSGASIRHVISGLEPSFQRRVALTESTTKSPGDITITWHQGRVVRDTAVLLKAITEALRSCLPSSPAFVEHNDAG